MHAGHVLNRPGQTGVHRTLTMLRATIDREVARINAVIERNGLEAEPSFLDADREQYEQLRCTGEARSGRQLAEMTLYFLLWSKAPMKNHEVLEVLNSSAAVEFAIPQPLLAPPPNPDYSPSTPTYAALQGYFAPAPSGIDVTYARQVPGGRGETVRVVDVEQGVHIAHEDLPDFVSLSGYLYDEDELRMSHGDSVVGIIAAVENGYGMTGIAPAVEMGISSPVGAPPTRTSTSKKRFIVLFCRPVLATSF